MCKYTQYFKIIYNFISNFAGDMHKEMFSSSNLFAHVMAFVTVTIWGVTFISTKILIAQGLTPVQIFVSRFSLAYVSIWLFCSKRLFADNVRDELTFLLLGITGGSLYFMTENMALCYSTASNVSLIVCICPLLTTFLISIFYHSEQLSLVQWIGSLIACGGMALVVMNGHFVLHLSPLGDTLAFCAALCWAFYSLFVKNISQRYPSVFITRKLLFYGLLTILPYFAFVPDMPSPDVFVRPQVYGNILFLGIIASMLCYITWNWCIVHLGAVNATNYIYFNPLMTIFFAWLILNEHITAFIIAGALMILFGMFLVEKRR